MLNERSTWTDKQPNATTPDLHPVIASRTSPGIVILNGLGEVIHMNDTATEMLSIMRQHAPVSKNGLVPQVMMDLCHELDTKGLSREAASHAQLEATRFIAMAEGKVLLRAFALEGAKDLPLEGRRFLIMLEPVAERKQGPEARRERYCLTDREWQVTQALAQGYTNKEIANALRIAEPTVKSHLKHIMQKMKCTTRTAIVSRMAGSMACGSA